MDSFTLLKERTGDLHLYHSLSVRSSSLLTNPTQLSQNLCQADEALGLAGYTVFTFFLRWVYNFKDLAAWLMKSFGVGTDGILIPKMGFIEPLGEGAFPRTARDASAQIFLLQACSDAAAMSTLANRQRETPVLGSKTKFINAMWLHIFNTKSFCPEVPLIPGLCHPSLITWILATLWPRSKTSVTSKGNRWAPGQDEALVRWCGDPLRHLSHVAYASSGALLPELGFSCLSPPALSVCGIYW